MAVSDQSSLVTAHLGRSRLLACLSLAVVLAAAVAGFLIPLRSSVVASPLAITLIVLVMALWFAATADRDARSRLESVRRGYAVHGEVRRLLREFLLVYLVVLLRLQAVTACGVVIAVWGNGPLAALAVHLVAAVQMARAWPSTHKTNLLLQRAGVDDG